MPTPADVATWATVGWAGATAGIVFCRLLSGAVITQGLLRENPRGPIVADRVQFLALSLGGIIAYAFQTLSSLDTTPALPPISWTVTTLFGGSQLVYLIPKAIRILRRQ